MTPPTPREIRAEQDRWKNRMRECRFRRSFAKSSDERADQSIEAAYAAIIVGALAYALGEARTAATRIKVD
jgi:hypothetical protein